MQLLVCLCMRQSREHVLAVSRCLGDRQLYSLLVIKEQQFLSSPAVNKLNVHYNLQLRRTLPTPLRVWAKL